MTHNPLVLEKAMLTLINWYKPDKWLEKILVYNLILVKTIYHLAYNNHSYFFYTQLCYFNSLLRIVHQHLFQVSKILKIHSFTIQNVYAFCFYDLSTVFQSLRIDKNSVQTNATQSGKTFCLDFFFFYLG